MFQVLLRLKEANENGNFQRRRNVKSERSHSFTEETRKRKRSREKRSNDEMNDNVDISTNKKPNNASKKMKQKGLNKLSKMDVLNFQIIFC